MGDLVGTNLVTLDSQQKLVWVDSGLAHGQRSFQVRQELVIVHTTGMLHVKVLEVVMCTKY